MNRLKLEREKEEEERRRRLIEEEERLKQQIEREKEEYRKRLELEENERRQRYEDERQEMLKRQKVEEDALREMRKREEEYHKQLELQAKEKLQEIERLEKERLLEIERKEKERLLEIERLEQERLLEIERVEKERLRQLGEQEARLKKQLEDEEEERRRKIAEEDDMKKQKESQLRQKLELEEIERDKISKEMNERQKKIEQEQELENKKREKKSSFDLKIRNLCNTLNELKSRIENSPLNSKAIVEQFEDLKECEKELNNLNMKLNDIIEENEMTNEDVAEFELVKSYIKFINAQINGRHKELNEKERLLLKLKELDHNLQQYINLAKKLENEEKNLYLETFASQSPRSGINTTGSYVQNFSDLHEKIKSVAMIHASIKLCLKQINDIHNADKLHSTEMLHSLNQEQINANILLPLESHLNNLEKIETQWSYFDKRYNEIKRFLKIDIDYENLLSVPVNVSTQTVENVDSLTYELRKYVRIKQVLSEKLQFINDTIDMGQQLFAQICAPKLAKELNETKELVNEIRSHLDKKCSKLSLIQAYQDDLVKIEQKFCSLKNDFTTLEERDLNRQSDSELKANIQELNDLKKRIKVLESEKEKTDKQLQGETERVFDRNVQRLNEMFKGLLKQIETLEAKYQNDLLKNLPSRNATNDLNSWLSEKSKQLTAHRYELKNLKKHLNIQELDCLQKKLVELNDEFQAKEHTLKFIQEAMESEIKQGFYDITLCEQYTKLEQEWNHLKSQLHSDLEYIDILFIKLSEFNKETYDVEQWIAEQRASQVFNEEFETQIEAMRSQLDKVEQNYLKQHQQQQLDQSKYDINNDQGKRDNDWNSVVKIFFDQKIQSLRQSLVQLENLNEIHEERKLSKLKQQIISEINDIIMNIKLEVNFLNNGKLLTLQQYESSIETLKNFCNKLEASENELIKVCKNMNPVDLMSINETKRVISEILSHANTYILPSWVKHNRILQEIETNFNSTHSHIVKADTELSRLSSFSFKIPKIDPYESSSTELTVVSDYLSSSNDLADDEIDCVGPLEITLKKIEMDKQFDLAKDLERESKHLIENLTNMNTKQNIINTIENINEQHANLCNLIQGLHARYEEVKSEKRYYKELIKSTLSLMRQSYGILNIDDKDLDINRDLQRIKQILGVIKDNEMNLKMNVNRFREIDMNYTMETSTLSRNTYRLIDFINECESIVRRLEMKEHNLLARLNENQLKIESKLNEITLYLHMYENKCKTDLKTIDLNRAKLSVEPVLSVFAYMINQSNKLNDYKADLEAYLIEYASQQHEQQTGLQDVNEVKKVLDRINLCLNQLHLLQTSGFVRDFHDLNDIFKNLYDFENKQTISNSSRPIDLIDEEKSLQLKISFARFTDLKRSILNRVDSLPFIDKLSIQQIIEKLEWKLNEALRDSESIIDKLNKYRVIALNLEKELMDMEEKILVYENDNQKYDDYTNLEDQFNYYSKLKNYLQDNELKFNLELLQSIGTELERYRRYGTTNSFLSHVMKVSTSNLELLKTLEYLPNFEALRIKFLDLQYRLDIKLKQLESEFTNWKFIAKKSSRLLDIMKNYHQMLANSSVFNVDDHHESARQFTSKNEIQRIIQILKRDILNNLNDNESLKNEVISLSKKSSVKSRFINDIVTKIIGEWDLLNEQINSKIVKYEALYRKLNNLELNLLNLRQEIVVLEIYLNRDCFLNVNLNNYKEILMKQSELNDLLTRLNHQDESIMSLLRYCETNTRNQKVILALSDRWYNIKVLVKQKIIELQNIWLLICDLNEQIEKFSLIVTKTENFYYNTLLTINESNRNMMKFIENLYNTIRDDDKLLKYLNQSYMNVIMMAAKFVMFRNNELFKQKILFINSKWDKLHNDIAGKIKKVKYYFYILLIARIDNDLLGIWNNFVFTVLFPSPESYRFMDKVRVRT